MFFGTYTPRLDDKARLVLPAKFRDELAEGLVLAKGHEGCLYVWARDVFARQAAELARASMSDRSAREYRRALFGGARDDPADKQGRLTIPPDLREYAGLDKDVVAIGAMDHIEIWDAARWAADSPDRDAQYKNLDAPAYPGTEHS